MRQDSEWCTLPLLTSCRSPVTKNGAKVWDDPTPIGHYTYFRSKALHRNHDPDVIARTYEQFFGRILDPGVQAGRRHDVFKFGRGIKRKRRR
jgi:hypothetical protein